MIQGRGRRQTSSRRGQAAFLKPEEEDRLRQEEEHAAFLKPEEGEKL